MSYMSVFMTKILNLNRCSGIQTGFVNEMRMVAMKLHTREQAPKEGQQQAAPQPKAVSTCISVLIKRIFNGSSHPCGA